MELSRGNPSRPLMGSAAATSVASVTQSFRPVNGASLQTPNEPPNTSLRTPTSHSVPFAIPLPSNLKLAQDPISGQFCQEITSVKAGGEKQLVGRSGQQGQE